MTDWTKLSPVSPTIAGGRTKPIEKGGLPITLGLRKRDPFRVSGCDFGDKNCPINEDQPCSTMGSCYRALCECGEYLNMTDTEITDNDKHNYVGTTGTSTHNRHLAHMDSVRRKTKTSAISQHMIENHPNTEKIYNVKILSTHQSNLERITSEMLWIEQQNPIYSMNRKSGDGAWAHNSLVRLTTT